MFDNSCPYWLFNFEFPAIRDHCESYCCNLMEVNLFDLDDHPAAEVIDITQCFVEVEADAQIPGTSR